MESNNFIYIVNENFQPLWITFQETFVQIKILALLWEKRISSHSARSIIILLLTNLNEKSDKLLAIKL